MIPRFSKSICFSLLFVTLLGNQSKASSSLLFDNDYHEAAIIFRIKDDDPPKKGSPTLENVLGTTFYLMTENDIIQRLKGSYTIYSPPKNGLVFDPDDGMPAIVVNSTGFTMVEPFVQTIYPAQSPYSNINGEVAHEAKYYDGCWYRGIVEGIETFILYGHKITISVITFINGAWAGNATRIVETSPTSLIIIQRKEGFYYYISKAGSFCFKRGISFEERKDNDFWEKQKEVNSLQSFKEYLDKYPQGIHAKEAKERVTAIDDDRNLWEAAKREDSKASYQKYVYSNGEKRYESEAKQRIREIEHEEAVAEDNDIWNTIKYSNIVSDFTDYLSRVGYKGHIPEATKSKNLLLARQTELSLGTASEIVGYYNQLIDSYFLPVGEDEIKFKKAKEMRAFAEVRKNQKQEDAEQFLTDYPNSEYYNEVSDIVAMKMADNMPLSVTKEQYNQILSYAISKDAKLYVKNRYNEKRKELKKIVRGR